MPVRMVRLAGSHTPFSINSDAELAAFPDKTGNGLIDQPYIIKDLVIDAAESGSAVLINNTRAYLVLQNCSFANASATSGRAGIELRNASNIQIFNCSLLHNKGYGVYVYNSTNVTILEGIFLACGIYMYKSSSINTTKSNFREAHDTIYSYTCNLITAQENNVMGYYGIDFSNTNNSIVRANSISNATGDGISISGSVNVNVSQNQAHRNGDGIYVGSSTNVLITNNDVSENREKGIYILFSDYCTINNNNGYFCGTDGLRLTTSSHNYVYGNNLIYNEKIGLNILSSSSSNTITNNRILGNIDRDIEAQDSNDNTISNNKYCTSFYWTTTNTISNNLCENIPNLNPAWSDYSNAKHAIVQKMATISFVYDSQPMQYGLYLCVMFLDNTSSQKVLVSSAFLRTENEYYVGNAWSTISYNLSFSAQGFYVQASGVKSSQSPPVSFGELIHSFRLHFANIESSLFPLDLTVSIDYAISGPGFNEVGSYQTTANFPIDETEDLSWVWYIGIGAAATVSIALGIRYKLKKRAYLV